MAATHMLADKVSRDGLPGRRTHLRFLSQAKPINLAFKFWASEESGIEGR